MGRQGSVIAEGTPGGLPVCAVGTCRVRWTPNGREAKQSRGGGVCKHESRRPRIPEQEQRPMSPLSALDTHLKLALGAGSHDLVLRK